MKQIDFYSKAHLIVAAIRILEHKLSSPPSVNDISAMLSFSPEQGNLLCRKLEEMGIVSSVEVAFGEKITLNNHLLIEDIPRGAKETRMDEELNKFKESQKKFIEKVESIQKEQEKKKKDLFAEIDRKLKQRLEKNQ